VTFTTTASGDNAGSAARIIVIVPPTFSRQTAFQPFSAIDSAGTKYCPPALLTRMSTRPPAASTMRAAEAGSRMSPATHEHPRSEAAAASTSSRRPAMTTEAPQASSSFAVAFPKPVPPPVTIAARPRSISAVKIRDEELTAIPPS
jgi:hypothetical protein